MRSFNYEKSIEWVVLWYRGPLFVLDDVSMLSFFPQPFRRREGEKEKGVCVGIQCGS